MIIAAQTAWRDVLYDEQFILAVSTLLAALVTYFGFVIKTALSRLQVKAEATHEQVANTHEINLRDDIDEKFEKIESRIDERHQVVVDEILKLSQAISQVYIESGKQHAALWEALHSKTTPRPKHK